MTEHEPSQPEGLTARIPLLHSLQIKLFIPVLVVLVVLIFLQARSIAIGNREEYARGNQELLQVGAKQLADGVLESLVFGDHDESTFPEMLNEALRLSGISMDERCCALVNPRGEPLAVGGLLVPESATAARRPWPTVTDTTLLKSTTPFLNRDEAWQAALHPLPNLTSCRRCHAERGEVNGWVLVGLSQENVRATERAIQRVGGIAAVVASIVFGITVWLLVAIHVRRPLSGIASAMSRVMDGDLTVRYDTVAPDEIGHLGNRFNEMVTRLEEVDHELHAKNVEIMERAERMVTIGEMASRLAHEIRNPLAGIESVLSVMHEETPDGSDDRPILHEALLQVRRIDRTISDLLSFARPRKPEFARQSIHEIISGLVSFCQQPSVSGSHQITYRPGSDVPPVEVDRDQISQALLNMVLNALRVMTEPGVVTISTIATAEGGLEVRVRDTGPGIPTEDLPRIFDAFYTTRSKGTGLGLAISRSVIIRHGGALDVASTGPAGTEFRFSLPATSPGEGAEDPEVNDPHPG